MGWFAECETPAGRERLRAKTESEARSFADYLNERHSDEDKNCEVCTKYDYCWDLRVAAECNEFEDIR